MKKIAVFWKKKNIESYANMSSSQLFKEGIIMVI